MGEWLSQAPPGVLIPAIPILCGSLIALTAIVSNHWRKHRQTELEITLKQDMLNRGFTAEEIERVVKASRSK